jgi:hypothetical protein
LFAGRGDILIYTPKSSIEYAQSADPFEQALDNPIVIALSQGRPGPDAPQWKSKPIHTTNSTEFQKRLYDSGCRALLQTVACAISTERYFPFSRKQRIYCIMN